MEGDASSGFFDYVREGSILHGDLAWLVRPFEWAAAVIDVVAILVLLIGAGRFVVGFALAEINRSPFDRAKGVNRERVELARYILAGLEILIVSDIIHTAISLAMADLVFLGLLVVIRSIVSFFLEREVDTVRRELGD